jgi:glyoxylase-like metal-dependent hydrolase (beta-lactamase superfamily II)
MKHALLRVAAAVAAATAVAQDGNIDVLHVQGSVHMLHSPDGNLTVQAGDDGILLVDSLSAERADEIYAAIAPLSQRPIQLIVNTHAHPSHTGGNGRLRTAWAGWS